MSGRQSLGLNLHSEDSQGPNTIIWSILVALYQVLFIVLLYFGKLPIIVLVEFSLAMASAW